MFSGLKYPKLQIATLKQMYIFEEVYRGRDKTITACTANILPVHLVCNYILLYRGYLIGIINTFITLCRQESKR